MNARIFASLICATALLFGCAGQSTTPSITPNGFTPTGLSQNGLAPTQSDTASRRVTLSLSKGSGNVKHRIANVTIRIRIPHKHRHRRAHYISTGTQGMTFAFAGPTTVNQSVGVTPSSPGCSSGGGGTTCTFTLRLTAGSYTGTISAFDQAPVSGNIPGGANLLSTARNQPFTIVAYQTNNLSFTLDGVVASLTVSGLPSATIGTAFGSAQGFTVTAKDASGETIVGTYDNAITLSTTDSTNAAIATSGSDSPAAGELVSSSDSATLNYGGGAIASAAIGASATGATSGNATFAPTPVLTSIALANAGGVTQSNALVGAETVLTLTGHFATAGTNPMAVNLTAPGTSLNRVTLVSATQMTADLFLDPHVVTPGSISVSVGTSAHMNSTAQNVTTSNTGVDVVTLATDSTPGSPAGSGTGTSGDLRYAILNASAGDTIVFDTTAMCGASACTITLGGPLPPIVQNLTIDGGYFLSGIPRVTIDGASTYRALWAKSGTITLANLQIQNVRAQGGSGGGAPYVCGGGGGAGLGAGLFIDAATVDVVNDYFVSAAAAGGGGGSLSVGNASVGGGGGGLGGNGGTGGYGGGGAGGILGAGSPGGNPGGGNGGQGFSSTGGAGGVSGTNGGTGGYGGGGGGGGYDNGSVTGGGGSGGFGGGGGGAGFSSGSAGSGGGAGGFGGGGGGCNDNGDPAGNGGPGGGGGGANIGGGNGGALSSSVHGGGSGGNGGAGGGAAAGPAIFVNAGSLTTANSGASNATATGGAGGLSFGAHPPGVAGSADATPVFNYGGTVNGVTVTAGSGGPVASALGSTAPQLRPRERHRKPR